MSASQAAYPPQENEMSVQPTSRIRIARYFDVPAVRLWQAWSDPELVRLWFGSDPNGVVIRARLDVQVGGKFEVTFANSDMTEYTCYGIYQEVEHNSKLLFTWSWKNAADIEERVSVSFQEDRSGALMTFEHFNIDPNTGHGYEIGWSTTFDKLEKILKTSGSWSN
jgi:uncharacterized protein YndB with AHSA1/START domain